jgi:hypothetical protein
LGRSNTANQVKTLTAKDAKYGFGPLIGLVNAPPVIIAKYGRSVALMIVEEKFEPLKSFYGLIGPHRTLKVFDHGWRSERAPASGTEHKDAFDHQRTDRPHLQGTRHKV